MATPQTFAVPYSRTPGSTGYNFQDSAAQEERGEASLSTDLRPIIAGRVGFPWRDFIGGQFAKQGNPNILVNDNGYPVSMITDGNQKFGTQFEVDYVEDPTVTVASGFQLKSLNDAGQEAWHRKQVAAAAGTLNAGIQTDVLSGIEDAYDWAKVFGRMEGWANFVKVGFYDKQRYDKEDLLEQAKQNKLIPEYEYFFIFNFLSAFKYGKDANAILSLYTGFGDNWHTLYMPHAHQKTAFAFGRANDGALGAWTVTGTPIAANLWKISADNLLLLRSIYQKAGMPMVTHTNGSRGYHLIIQDDVFDQAMQDPKIQKEYQNAAMGLGANKSLMISGYDTGAWQSFIYQGIKMWKCPRSENTDFNTMLELEKLYGDGFQGDNLTVTATVYTASTGVVPHFTGGTFTETNMCSVPNAIASNFCIGIVLGAQGLWTRNMGADQAAMELGINQSNYKLFEGTGLLHPFAMGRMERLPKTMPAFTQSETTIMSTSYLKCNGSGIVIMAKPLNAATWGQPWGDN